MRKLIAVLVLVAACHTTRTTSTGMGPVTNGNQTGAPDALSALRGFLAAAKQQDLQAMGALFGDRDGTARDRIPRDELEKREIVMASCLKHDRYDVIGDAPAAGGSRMMQVNLAKGDRSAAVNFELIAATDHRWYVKSFDLTKLMSDYCKR